MTMTAQNDARAFSIASTGSWVGFKVGTALPTFNDVTGKYTEKYSTKPLRAPEQGVRLPRADEDK